MIRHLINRASCIAAFVALSWTGAMAFLGYDGSDALHARDLHGNWSLDEGGGTVTRMSAT